jgi:hypothetical protein
MERMGGMQHVEMMVRKVQLGRKHQRWELML